MNRLLITLAFFVVSLVSFAQGTQSENHIHTKSYKEPVKENELSSSTVSKSEAIIYYDGLGRPTQSVLLKASNNNKDIITQTGYDNTGRPVYNYLPFVDMASGTVTNGKYREDAEDQNRLFYMTSEYENTTNPYSQTIYEKSPLARVTEQAAPGADWSYDPTKLSYEGAVYENYATGSFKYLSKCWWNDDFINKITSGVFVPKDPNKTTLKILNDVLTFSMTSSSTGRMKVGTIKKLNVTPELQNITLGYIQKKNPDNTFSNSSYKVSIINNELRITSDNNLNEEVITPKANFSINLTQVQYRKSYTKKYSANNTVRMAYDLNATNEVYNFKVQFLNGDSKQPSLVYQNHYPENVLSKIISRDENWQLSKGKAHTSEVFKDKHGKVILKRQYVKEGSNDVALDTYYVYDDFGNLTYVLSPKATDAILNGTAINTDVLNKLGYQYKYDHKNRIIEKKGPEKDWECMVYDRFNRLVLTQNAKLKAENKWLFTKYDVFGRVTYSGKYTNNADRASLQGSVNAHTSLYETKLDTEATINGAKVYYTNNAFPNSASDIEILSINYYDNYKFDTTLAKEASAELEPNPTGLLVSSSGIISKSLNTTAWDASFDTKASITGDGGISYTVLGTTNKRVMVGLTLKNQNTSHGYNTIGYAIGSGYDNLLRVFVSGTEYHTGMTYQAYDKLAVERINGKIHYKKNGVTFYVASGTSTGELIGDSSFLHYGAAIQDVLIYYSVDNTAITGRTKGMPTGSKVKVLGTTDTWITSITHYDNKGRAFYVVSKDDFLGTNDVTYNRYDFTGKVLYSKSTHTKGSNTPIVTENFFTYDAQGKLITQSHSINGTTKETLVENTYDTLGAVKSKKNGVQTHTVDTKLTNLKHVVQEGEYLRKLLSYSAYNGNIQSSTSIPSGSNGYVEYKVTATGKLAAIGLSNPNDPNLNDSFDKIDHAIFLGLTADHQVKIYEKGAVKSYSPVITYAAGDTFSVERDGTSIRYKKNGVEFAKTENTNAYIGLMADGCLGTPGVYIKDFRLVILNTNAGQALQNTDYVYNVRGWLKSINNVEAMGNDLFAMKLNYNTTDITGSQKLYNGNIAEAHWRTLNDDKKRSYAYGYDALNRMKTASYSIENDIASANRYNVGNITYDKNGNILTLQRNGFVNNATAQIDDLVYSYFPNSNRLRKVEDGIDTNNEGFIDDSNTTDDYDYDVDGSLTKDENKGITSITYNYMNLPKEVVFNSNPGKKIVYIYDAAGSKLKKEVHDTGNTITTEYANNFVYKNGTLEFFNHAEGIIERDQSSHSVAYKYIYQFTDHLGNVRLSYSDADKDGKVDVARTGGRSGNVDVDGDGDYGHEIIEENNFYPFGLKHKGYNNTIAGRDHAFEYNGKEMETSLGYNMMEMDMRQYDPAIARWVVQDPVTHHNYSPYNAFDNNPVFYADPSGADAIWSPNNTVQNSYKPGDHIRAGHGEFNSQSVNFLNQIAKGGLNAVQDFYAWIRSSHTRKKANNTSSDSSDSENTNVTITDTSIITSILNVINSNSSISIEISESTEVRPPVAGDIQFINPDGKENKDNSRSLNEKGDDQLKSPPAIKWVGFYKGILVFETPYVNGGAMTLPGIGIFLNPGDFESDPDVLRHEWGHILQSYLTGRVMFYNVIGVGSLISTQLPGRHQDRWTEKSANQLAYWALGKPKDWNHYVYPVYIK